MKRRHFLFGALGAAVPLSAVAVPDVPASGAMLRYMLTLAGARERAMISYMIERRVWDPSEICKHLSAELELIEDSI